MAEDVEQVHLETRAQWRAWLAEHHATARGVQLVSWRSGTGRPAVGYDEAVCEALCFGWVDSTNRRLDEERGMQYFAPRKPRSGWARTNKARVERLRAEGLMTEAGERAIAVAVANGSWALLDDVEDGREPDDLRTALDARPEARRHWDAFPPSARKVMLQWLAQARTDATRTKRVAGVVDGAAAGVRAYPPARPR
ncbi:YdeI/OmpD-associated family protein [Microlunatus lacustris]